MNALYLRSIIFCVCWSRKAFAFSFRPPSVSIEDKHPIKIYSQAVNAANVIQRAWSSHGNAQSNVWVSSPPSSPSWRSPPPLNLPPLPWALRSALPSSPKKRDISRTPYYVIWFLGFWKIFVNWIHLICSTLYKKHWQLFWKTSTYKKMWKKDSCVMTNCSLDEQAFQLLLIFDALFAHPLAHSLYSSTIEYHNVCKRSGISTFESGGHQEQSLRSLPPLICPMLNSTSLWGSIAQLWPRSHTLRLLDCIVCGQEKGSIRTTFLCWRLSVKKERVCAFTVADFLHPRWACICAPQLSSCLLLHMQGRDHCGLPPKRRSSRLCSILHISFHACRVSRLVRCSRASRDSLDFWLESDCWSQLGLFSLLVPSWKRNVTALKHQPVRFWEKCSKNAYMCDRLCSPKQSNVIGLLD